MNLKKRIALVIVFFGSILTPLYFYSLIEIISNSFSLELQNIEKRRELDFDIPAQMTSVKEGFYPLITPQLLIKHFFETNFYPVGTLPHTKTFYCNEGYGLVTYKSDRFGFRNEDSNWDKIGKRGVNFFIGDSFVHGACVEDKSTIPSVFSNFSDSNVLNLGTGDNGPYEYVALLKGIVSPINQSFKNKEKKVILVFYENDANILSIKKLSRKKFSHLNRIKEIAEIDSNGNISPTVDYLEILSKVKDKNLPLNKKEILSVLKKRENKLKHQLSNRGINPNEIIYRLVTIQPIRIRVEQLLSTFINKKNQEQSPSYFSIKTLSEICNGENFCTPYISYIPNSNYWRKSRIKTSNLYKIKLKEIADKFSIKFLDGSLAIDQDNLEDYAPKGSHLSKDGYKKFAIFLSKEIE